VSNGVPSLVRKTTRYHVRILVRHDSLTLRKWPTLEPRHLQPPRFIEANGKIFAERARVSGSDLRQRGELVALCGGQHPSPKGHSKSALPHPSWWLVQYRIPD